MEDVKIIGAGLAGSEAAASVAVSVVAAGASVLVELLLPHAAKDIVITAAIPNAVNFLNFIFVSSL